MTLGTFVIKKFLNTVGVKAYNIFSCVDSYFLYILFIWNSRFGLCFKKAICVITRSFMFSVQVGLDIASVETARIVKVAVVSLYRHQIDAWFFSLFARLAPQFVAIFSVKCEAFYFSDCNLLLGIWLFSSLNWSYEQDAFLFEIGRSSSDVVTMGHRGYSFPLKFPTLLLKKIKFNRDLQRMLRNYCLLHNYIMHACFVCSLPSFYLSINWRYLWQTRYLWYIFKYYQLVFSNYNATIANFTGGLYHSIHSMS